ncbi:HpcH/HpaI aldolase/citrate lyase family protein [Acinetobacter bouvetii]|uniref:(3S)-malyl-CoA thioesterase n=1 Tax=Acinetobacter bouvetii TaxID=202951 RepID=A0A811GIJ6_9GAMM|nr:CoA ester lyase [Acinetobacter bouvetii]CAB1221787.1 (3S)-malyl-CoA thioesterase [Acinetobacter bouvetii]
MKPFAQHARSYLFVPANRTERFEKALNTAADAVIIDLEDAVPADLKHAARESLSLWLQAHPEYQVMIRINARQSKWFQDDQNLLQFANVMAIVLPKTESAADIQAVTAIRALDIYALIETPRGLAQVREIAATASVKALMFGSIDFQLEMDMQGGYHELLAFRNEIVLASKLAGIQAPIDGVTVDFKDEALIELETHQAKNLGFGGKLCIHPNQVALVNQTFSPTAEELEWAHRVLHAEAQAAGQAVSLDGKMIDLPVILKAKKLLQQAALNVKQAQ